MRDGFPGSRWSGRTVVEHRDVLLLGGGVGWGGGDEEDRPTDSIVEPMVKLVTMSSSR